MLAYILEKSFLTAFIYLKTLERNTALVEKERRRSQELLENILPKQFVKDVKKHGSFAQHYKGVSVLIGYHRMETPLM